MRGHVARCRRTAGALQAHCRQGGAVSACQPPAAPTSTPRARQSWTSWGSGSTMAVLLVTWRAAGRRREGGRGAAGAACVWPRGAAQVTQPCGAPLAGGACQQRDAGALSWLPTHRVEDGQLGVGRQRCRHLRDHVLGACQRQAQRLLYMPGTRVLTQHLRRGGQGRGIQSEAAGALLLLRRRQDFQTAGPRTAARARAAGQRPGAPLGGGSSAGTEAAALARQLRQPRRPALVAAPGPSS